MDKHAELCNRITEALTFFSEKVSCCVISYQFDTDLDMVAIYLKPGTDRGQFCHMLAATGLFSDNDEFRVLIKI